MFSTWLSSVILAIVPKALRVSPSSKGGTLDHSAVLVIATQLPDGDSI